MTRSISAFINSIAKNGGMSFSNGYDIEFDFSKTNSRGEGISADFELLGDHLNRVVENYNAPDSLFKMLCDEAQYPTFSLLLDNCKVDTWVRTRYHILTRSFTQT